MQYFNFNIFFDAKGDDKFKIRVESISGTGTAVIDLTHDIEQLSILGHALAREVRQSGAVAELDPALNRDAEFDAPAAIAPLELGKQLYQDLFVGAAGAQLNQALGNVQSQDSGLRIRLHIDPNDAQVARLASLPWELLCHPFMGDQPMALSNATPLVRQLDSPLPVNTRAFKPPLRILVVVSNPDGVAPLDLQKERGNIERSWGNKPNVVVEFLENATLKALTRKLSHNDYHVFHFMGHGDFDHATGVGCLLLETADNRPDPVDGKTLGLALKDAKSMRLIFLNACNTAQLNRTPGKDAYAGVATALVMVGIPAVVAMQFPVSDGAAIEFADSLYSNLVRGASIENAVTEGRKAIRFADRTSLEWATPVLFMSTSDGALFGDRHSNPTPESESEENALTEHASDQFRQNKTANTSKHRPLMWTAAITLAGLGVLFVWMNRSIWEIESIDVAQISIPVENIDPLPDPTPVTPATTTTETEIQPTVTLPDSSLLAHYKLDGPSGDKNKMADATGKYDARFTLVRYSGEPQNDQVFEVGPIGKAARFTTDGDPLGLMTAGHIPFGANGRPFTLSTWLKINQMNSERLLGQDQWVSFDLHREKLRFGVFNDNGWNKNLGVTASRHKISQGEWLFVAATYEKGLLSLHVYKQGALLEHVSADVSLSNPGRCSFVVGVPGEKPCVVGQYEDQSNSHPASYDDIRIYATALSRAQLDLLAGQSRL
ncbi:MAG: CHAT domain-containing protein [Gammaproteobacteria bacterium]